MSAYMIEVDVSAQATYPTQPQVIIPFSPKSVSVINMGTDADEFYMSYDGVNDVAHVLAHDAVDFSQDATRIWLRRGTVCAVRPQVIAER